MPFKSTKTINDLALYFVVEKLAAPQSHQVSTLFQVQAVPIIKMILDSVLA